MKLIETNWQLVTDRVMGGVSSGQIEQTKIDDLEATRMTGRVSLKNNGGFVQIATAIAPPPARTTGVAMQLIGNTESYNIHLRTSDLNRPWQSYRHEFVAPAQWTLCHFDFADFEAYRTDQPLVIANITRIGIVAIGRIFDADAAVASVSYY